ncbi:MAG: hypothetical protein COB06_014920 [Pseudomonas sp.]|jgi:hypothetical protein|uniref:hypothetical protein n=1 Tax=Pseudomonas TaxID=286 RepID=UPI0008958DD8|nr:MULTISPECIES: hypothetical protein [unclassified Pseudomonas]MDP9058149.1 hypothetical protein [Pseudomonadota bacterium]MBL1308518.1 hypothetical protein [Pseudomonas sp.]MDE1909825.1 hypothetical protein [Pseudomonas sp.]MDE2034002.1 hypothetical protein [Pseudomonas sp.]MDE2190659.1 hypothetical protein [Pseudomonas sp.]
MRTLNSLTQNLIESLTQLLEQPGEDALQALEVCAPVLIEELQQVLIRAVDRRDIESQLQTVLANWLRQHPQPENAESALLEALRKQALLSSKSAAEAQT